MSQSPTHGALDFDAIAKKALSDTPPKTRFGEKDAEVIRKNAEALPPRPRAFTRPATTLGAIIAYGYEMAWKNVVGIPPALAERAAHEEAARLFPLRSHGKA